MDSIGQSLDGLTAVVISHDHGDHCSGVGVLDRKLQGVPVFITEPTYHAVQKKKHKEFSSEEEVTQLIKAIKNKELKLKSLEEKIEQVRDQRVTKSPKSDD